MMGKKKENNVVGVPAVRFRGFDVDWGQCKLGDIATIFDGTHQTPKYKSSGVKFVSVENIRNLETSKFISRADFEKEYKNKKAEINDVLMTRIGDIGTANIIDNNDDLAYYVTLALMKPKDINSKFLKHAISSEQVQKNIWRRTLHIAFPKKINLSEINEVELSVPKDIEQKYIGEFFSNLDELITLHQRELEALKDIKKGFLKKMFPKEGKDRPEVRLSGYTEAWEQRKLSETTDVRDGTHDSPTYCDDGYPLVTSKNLTNNGIDLTDVSLISEADFLAINLRSKVDIGDIIFGMIGTIGNPVILDRDDFAIKNVALLKNGKNIDNKFLIQLLKSDIFNRYINKENAGGTQKFLGLSQIRNFEFLSPQSIEQEQIGEFFSKLDELITLHQRKLEVYEQLKQTYLNLMFVSEN